LLSSTSTPDEPDARIGASTLPGDAPVEMDTEDDMARTARDVMTADPACCSPDTTLDQVAKMMVLNDCGEIPVIDSANRPIGVITDRDIVCRVVADSKNPMAHTAEQYMSQPVVTVPADAPMDDVVTLMEKHQMRRAVVVDERGSCAGIIAQADLAWADDAHDVAQLVREVSRETGRASK
jgi:CBS domain-containing protein